MAAAYVCCFFLLLSIPKNLGAVLRNAARYRYILMAYHTSESDLCIRTCWMDSIWHVWAIHSSQTVKCMLLHNQTYAAACRCHCYCYWWCCCCVVALLCYSLLCVLLNPLLPFLVNALLVSTEQFSCFFSALIHAYCFRVPNRFRNTCHIHMCRRPRWSRR